MQKILALESLRGLAALIVVFTHVAVAFFPGMVFGHSSAQAHNRFEELVAQSPLNILISGKFAVICFFVLSGFVLAYGYYTKKADLIIATVKRYFRLAPIVFFSVFFSYFFMKFSLYFNAQATLISGSPTWNLFWASQLSDMTILDAIWQGLIGTFVIQPDSSNSLNPVLWTIYNELIGSYLVFMVLSITNTDRRRWLIYLLLTAVFINTYFVGFIVGLVLCDIYIHKPSLLDLIGSSRKGYKIGLLVLATWLASYPANLIKSTDIGFVHKALAPFSNDMINHNVLYILASLIFIILILTSHKIKVIMEHRVLVLLGGMSYSLYATHLILLGSIGSYLFIRFNEVLPYNLAALASIILYLLVCIPVAYLFRKYIDMPSIAMGRKIIAGMGFDSKRKQDRETLESLL